MRGSDAKTDSSNPGGSFTDLTTSEGSIGLVVDFSELRGVGKSSALDGWIEVQDASRSAAICQYRWEGSTMDSSESGGIEGEFKQIPTLNLNSTPNYNLNRTHCLRSGLSERQL